MTATASSMADDSRSKIDGGFHDRAYPRIVRFMIVLAVLFTTALTFVFGWGVGFGFAVGCLIALLNFYWLKRVVGALADRATRTGTPQSARGIVLRFLLRYGMIAAGVYAIFQISSVSGYGLLAGLFLPVGGIACEAAYELYAGIRHGA
jgi:dipeptide/tripeptide permease